MDSNDKYSPIALFAYNRPEHLRKVLTALSECPEAKESKLFIFSDGPSLNTSSEDTDKVKKVRKFIREKQWCGEVIINENNSNRGLADSIVSGVSQILDTHDRIIVLEDDIVVSKDFLRFMNEALNIYKYIEEVMHISAFMLPLGKELPDTLFYNFTSCWGWATWKRSWNYFNSDPEFLYNELKRTAQLDKFNHFGALDLAYQLKANIKGVLRTWAVKWNASVYLKNGFSLHPGKSLTRNIGFDNSGTHTESNYEKYFVINDLSENIHLEQIPLKEHSEIRKYVEDFYNDLRPNKIVKYMYNNYTKNFLIRKFFDFYPKVKNMKMTKKFIGK